VRLTMSLRIVARNLLRGRMRTALTALGMVVGSAAVIGTASLGNGAESKIRETLARPESRTIYLNASVPRSSNRPHEPRSSFNRLLSSDYESIRSALGAEYPVSPRIYVPRVVLKVDGATLEVALEGIGVDGFKTASRSLIQGNFFRTKEIESSAATCVLSESLARLLYPLSSPLGRAITVNGSTFTIIGIVDDSRNETYVSSSKPDLHIYIPYTSMLKRLNKEAEISIAVQAPDVESVEATRELVASLAEARRGRRNLEFTTATAFDYLQIYAKGSEAVGRLLAAVGAISLLVGGIGIMNIMLANVSARTRDIGILQAIGARRKAILGQFLLESGTLGLLGGCVGIGLGTVGAWLLGSMYEWPMRISAASVAAALTCCLGVGVLFGVQPARLAADLPPVEALRKD
jgi:putative ABC transport system permease protein